MGAPAAVLADLERLRERADKRASSTPAKKHKRADASSDGGEPSGATCLIIRPLDGAATASAAQVAASVEPFAALGFPLASEALEKNALRTSLGWLDPRGLMGYSARSTYRDLYVYFDAADQASPENALATKVRSRHLNIIRMSHNTSYPNCACPLGR